MSFEDVLPGFVEFAYYALITYSLFGAAWGLTIPFFGTGGMALLAALCVVRLDSRAVEVYTPIIFPLACVILLLALQLTLHGESVGNVRSFIAWMFTLIVVQALTLRPGFLHRFAIAAFIIGLSCLPYLSDAYSSGGITRFGLTGEMGLRNPNGLGMWFGFCLVYFIVLGIETKHDRIRLVSWLMAIGCLYMVALTVSRGPLLAAAIATTIALRRLLKRSFVPVLLLLFLSWVILLSGLFEQVGEFYMMRGTVETGRFEIWPEAIKRFLSSPLTGFGISDVNVFVPARGRENPHNGFLYIALVSGVFPLVFFLAYWLRAARGAFQAHSAKMADAPFFIPLLVYALLETIILSGTFMYHWTIVVLATATAVRSHSRVRRMVRHKRRSERVLNQFIGSEP